MDTRDKAVLRLGIAVVVVAAMLTAGWLILGYIEMPEEEAVADPVDPVNEEIPVEPAPEEAVYDATFGTGDNVITVATGSPGVISILKAFAEPFAEAENAKINWIRRGSGAALRELKAGNVDMVMVHAPDAEKRAVEEGWAVHRTLFGGNEFYIVGPAGDPANIRAAESAKDAFARIAATESKFFSRGDDSGTHKREMFIWNSTAITPEGGWYIITYDFMTPTLMRAEEEQGYFMVDSSTFYVNQVRIQNLTILFRNDPVLFNVYHALVASPEKHPHANYAIANKFVGFISSPEGQQIIREFGTEEFGVALYNCADAVALLLAPEEAVYDATFGTGDNVITVATGSPGVISILSAFAEPFAEAENAKINWIRRGSGAALRELKAGNVDMVMVHAPDAEKRAVEEGWAVHRTLFGGNEFYIVGPADDPANIRDAESAKDAYTRIAATESKFFSRGDDSGTHKREMFIWNSTGITPEGGWYIITYDFMTPTLMRAEEEQGYFMVDSSTFYVNQARIQNLTILFRNDPILFNVYHALVASPEKHPHANYAIANKFVGFISSPEGQQIIREFGTEEFGVALYNCADAVALLLAPEHPEPCDVDDEDRVELPLPVDEEVRWSITIGGVEGVEEFTSIDAANFEMVTIYNAVRRVPTHRDPRGYVIENWTGIPLKTIMRDHLNVATFSSIEVIARDDFSSTFTQEIVDDPENILLLGLYLEGECIQNVERLAPARIVLPDTWGVNWVRKVATIVVIVNR